MTENKKEILPSEKAEKAAKIKKAIQERADAQTALLREDFGRTFSTDHGKRVLAWLARECGFAESPISAAAPNAEIDKDRTLWRVMNLSLYLQIRKLVPITVLKEIEYGDNVLPSGTLPPLDE